MKKFLILIFVIIIIVSGIFTYKHFQNKDNELKEIETSQLTPVSPVKNEDYFLMYIDKLSKDNSNIIINGTISRGNIKVNDEISIVGLDKKEVITQISKININNQETDIANEGDSISLVLDTDISDDYIAVGQAVIKTGTTKPIYIINARLNSISTDNISELESKVNTFSINTDIKCSVKVLSEENNEIKITLDVPIVIDNGIEFALKSNNKIIAEGISLNN
jgi:elongation factor Tu